MEEERLFRVYPASASRQSARRKIIFLLRLSLAAVFFWFGVLKVAGASPALDLLKHSFPLLADSPYLEMLGAGEMAIALGLVIDRLAKHASLLMMLHLVCTLTVALVSPSLIFSPSFPVLTMEGEFIAKNIVLIMAGMVILASEERQK
ncbi:MAG: DUF417 family protein [Acidobacteriota bacterium]